MSWVRPDLLAGHPLGQHAPRDGPNPEWPSDQGPKNQESRGGSHACPERSRRAAGYRGHGSPALLTQERGGNKLESIELARKIVNAIADKKGSDIILLDLRSISLLADYFVICSGQSERQVKAIVSEITEKIKEEGVRPLHVEGDSSSGWVLVDYGGVIVHVFAPAVRGYYQLEKLWSDATVVVRMQ